MSRPPLASIIISNYNGKDLLRDCLNSLGRLKYPNYEVIVVDSGSTDGAPEMVKNEFPWVKLIRRGKIGIGKAINIGISKSRGDILVFDLNNDDIVSEDWLNPLVKTLLSSPKVGVVCGKRYIADTNGILDSAGSTIFLGITIGRGHGKKDSAKYNRIQEVDYVAVLATRRDVIERVGLLDEDFYIYGEDVDFCLRARKLGYKIVYVPSSVFYHRRSTTIGEKSPRGLYWTARSRILLILKHYPLHKKIPLLLLHSTFVPFFYILFYTYLFKGGFFSFMKAQFNAIRDAITGTKIIHGVSG